MENSYRDIIVIGMHRSGTSAIANLLNKMGVGVGDSEALLDTASDNEKGFFERLDIIAVNDLILRENNSEWDEPDTEKLSRIASKPVTPAIGAEIENIIHSYRSERASFAKDPRFCLTLPVWKNYLTSPIYIVCLRNPLEVARSLQKRNGFSLFKGLGLWEIYLWSLFSNVELEDCIFVNFNTFTRNPESVGEVLSRQLSARGIRLSQSWQKAVEASFDASLKHEQSSQADLERLLSTRQLGLWNMIIQEDYVSLADSSRKLTFSGKNEHLAQRITDVGYSVNELQLKVYTDQSNKIWHSYAKLVKEKSEWRLLLPEDQRTLSTIKVRPLNKPCVVKNISIELAAGDTTIPITQFIHNGFHDPITGWYYFADSEPCILLDDVEDYIESIAISVEYASLYEGEITALLCEAFAHYVRQNKNIFPVWDENQPGNGNCNYAAHSFSDTSSLSAESVKGKISVLFQALRCGLSIKDMVSFMKNYTLLRANPCYFSFEFYRNTYPDVMKANLDPLVHFLLAGWKEGRNPSGNFDMKFYLENNKDVEESGLNPLLHFIQTGWKEGRDPNENFDCTKYLADYPHAKQEGIDPLAYLFNRQR